MVPTPARCVGIYWSTNRTWNCGCALDTFTGSDVDLRHRGIPLSHFLTAIIRYPNKARYVKPLILWAALSLPLALAVLIARPWLIWFGAFYLIALSLNIALARNKLERSLANDVIFIVECGIDADHVGDRIWHGRPCTYREQPFPRTREPLGYNPLGLPRTRRLDSPRQITHSRTQQSALPNGIAGVVDLFP